MLTDEGSPLSSERECLYAADGDYNKKLKPIEILGFGVQFQWMHQQNNSCTTGAGSNKEETERFYEPEDQEVCSELVCPSNVRCLTNMTVSS